MKHKIVYICFLIVIPFSGNSQSCPLLLFSDTPQSISYNPSSRLSAKWYISVPLAGNFDLDVQNSGFTWEQFNTGELFRSLQKKNFALLENSWQILGGGIQYKDFFYTLEINRKRKAGMVFPDYFMDFRKGNWDYDNNGPLQYHATGIEASGEDYTEIALGLSKPLSDRFTIGFRVKYLLGASGFKTENIDINVNTEPNGDITVESETSLLASHPKDVNFISRGVFSNIGYNGNRFLYISGNQGFAVDGGLTAKLKMNGKDLYLGFAFNDLGFIQWKNDARRYIIHDTYTIDGTDISGIITGNSSSEIINYWGAVSDSLDSKFKAEEEYISYKSMLQGSFSFSWTLNYNERLDFGAVWKNNYGNGSIIPVLTLMASTNYAKKYRTMLGYSLTKNSYANIGLGFSANFGTFQLYAASNNALSLLIPDKTKNMSFTFGVNIISLSKYKGRFNTPGNNFHSRAGNRTAYKRPIRKSVIRKPGSINNNKKNPAPGIHKVINTYTNEENSTITPGSTIKVTGTGLKIMGDNEKAGVWLINTGNGTRVKVQQIIVNDEEELTVMIPESIKPGSYRIEINTYYDGKKNPSEKLKKGRSRHALNTVEK